MRKSAKLLTALFVASMAFGFVGCSGEVPKPPVELGQVDKADNGAELSIMDFVVTKPDFLDSAGRYARPSEGQEEVAIVRLKVKNTSSSEITYKPLHFEGVKNRMQLCTDPDLDHPETRTNFKAIDFGQQNPYHTPGQHIDQRVTIQPGHEIVDEYLFEPPVVNNEKLVVIIPGSIIGDSKRNFRFYVGQPKDVKPSEPASLRQPVELEGLEVKVTQVTQEYAELLPRTPKEGLKYAYAYTNKPVMAVYISITNKSREPRSYDPGHAGDGAGINMLFSNSPLDRAKIKSGAYGKKQVPGKISINPNATVEDVYYFVAPDSGGKLNFSLSGHLFSVKGIYRFKLDYTPSNPSAPDLKPYLHKDSDSAADAAADAPAEAANAEADAAAADDAEEEEEDE